MRPLDARLPMTCDVCGCETGQLYIAKPPERTCDECPSCNWKRIHKVDTLRSDLARVTDERDAARSEVARLTAEVEAMRATADRLAVLLKGNHVGHGAFPRSGCGVCKPVDDVLDALRARKVGG